MRDLIIIFLSAPVSVRAAIFIFLVFVLWRTFKRQILIFSSIIPWLLKNATWLVYLLIEIPISILHKEFGGAFGTFDQGWTSAIEQVYLFSEKLFKKLRNPTKVSIHRRTVFVYWGIIIYLIVPLFLNLTELPFTFWQESYVKNEMAIVKWVDNKGWLEKR